ncbi:MAG TPA: 3-hydroxyacyl-CoA dehydrogenase NAD-binding domain-containing protein [Spirochaetota bacterium]|nr:3-hydroxyacyl-CoA dehydrogenase NAD-binding domain-containing protein [Spirochaetota bacterium]
MECFGIVGAGMMGTDIAHLALSSGFRVVVCDCDAAQLDRARETLGARFKRYVAEGRFRQEEMDGLLSRLITERSIGALAECDMVLECVTEDRSVKMEVFRALDGAVKGGAILATNTSSISITRIASVTKRPESVIGMHFMYPARVMKLVELVCGLATTRETFESAKAIVRQFGKQFVESQDSPGFLLNRIFAPMINEAVFALYEGAGTAESIDKAMKLGTNVPLGPLELADMMGLDVVLAVIEVMFDEFGDPKYRPCPLLKKYVAAGYLGKKSGRGFYTY